VSQIVYGLSHQIQMRNLVCRIWRNRGARGPWYTVGVDREYTDGFGQKKTARTFGVDDLLPLAEIVRAAWRWIDAQNDHGQGETSRAFGVGDLLPLSESIKAAWKWAEEQEEGTTETQYYGSIEEDTPKE